MYCYKQHELQLKHKTELFLLRSIEPFNLQRERFLQLDSHKVQERLIDFFFLTLTQGKDIFFPILFEYFGWEKVIVKLNIVHQQASCSAVTIHPRMYGC